MTTTNVITTSGAFNFPFTARDYTNSINVLQSLWGALSKAGYFPMEPLATDYVEINLENDVISVLPVTNGAPTKARQNAAESRIFKVPAIEHLDHLTVSDIKNMMTLYARTRQPETLANLMAKRLGRFKKKFDLTVEWMRMGALKGVMTDGKGVEIIDFFAAFGLTKKVVYFDLSNASADLQSACALVYQLITQDLSDETMTEVQAWVDPVFFNALIQHPKVEKFWEATNAFNMMANLARGEEQQWKPRQFKFGSITWLENPAVIPLWTGPSKMIAANTGHAYPAGTQDTHVTYVSPPDDIAMLDGGDADINAYIHITEKMMDHGKGIELLGSMNALPFWRRPKLLVELHGGTGSSTTPLGG